MENGFTIGTGKNIAVVTGVNAKNEVTKDWQKLSRWREEVRVFLVRRV